MNPTRVAVIGAGTMGHGIAYVAALAGCKVRLTDGQSGALPLAMGKIESLLEGGVRRGKITEQERNQVHERLRAEPQVGTAGPTCHIVVDAIGDGLATKQRL